MDPIISSFLVAVRNVLILVLCLAFLGVGMLKLVGYQQMVSAFDRWGFPAFVIYLVGIYELLISIGIYMPKFRHYGLLGSFGLMLGALSVHMTFGEFDQLYGPIAILSLTLITMVVEYMLRGQQAADKP